MKTRKILLLFLTTVFLSSCSDEFLEPVRDTRILTDANLVEAAAIDPAIIEGNLLGISGFMIDDFGTLGDDAGRHYDIGQKGVDLWMDLVTGHMALTNSSFGWYNNSANYVATTDFTREENEIIWNYYYRIINTANSIILTAGGNNPSPDLDENTLRINAQAKAYRAYAYFYLAQLFQTEYDPAEPILPIYAIDQISSAKVPASDIYSLILSDLSFAIDNLTGYNRPSKSAIDETVVRGFLAYTHAAMGNYAEAKTEAEAVINSGYPLKTAGQLAFPGDGSGFNDVNNPSWIWGFDITADLGHQLVNWWGQIDYYTYSYAWAGDTKTIDEGLFNQIPDNDIRKTQFGQGFSALQPINKFFDLGRVPGGQLNITTDYLFMRVEEFYLLSAECSARLGDEAAAKSRLAELLSIRLGGQTEANNYLAQFSGPALINEIYFQTIIELWGEGKSYFAMKRNKASFTRGNNHLFLSGQTFSHNSDELSFQIPESEIINNPDISTQN